MKTHRRKTTKLKRRKEATAARGRTSAAFGRETKVARLTRELKESSEQQAATNEVLRVISSSPNDIQPVFDTIVTSAARLCKARYCWVFRFDGKLIHFAAEHGLSPEYMEATRRSYPIPPGWAWLLAQSGHRSLLSAQNLRPIDLVFGQNPCLAPRGIPPFIPRRQCHHRTHIGERD